MPRGQLLRSRMNEVSRAQQKALPRRDSSSGNGGICTGANLPCREIGYCCPRCNSPRATMITSLHRSRYRLGRASTLATPAQRPVQALSACSCSRCDPYASNTERCNRQYAPEPSSSDSVQPVALLSLVRGMEGATCKYARASNEPLPGESHSSGSRYSSRCIGCFAGDGNVAMMRDRPPRLHASQMEGIALPAKAFLVDLLRRQPRSPCCMRRIKHSFCDRNGVNPCSHPENQRGAG